MTPERQKKMEAVLAKRQPSLHVVLENVDDPHNVGAILRSCDAFGVIDVHLLYHVTRNTQHVASKVRMPRMSEIRSKSAASAAKWLRFTKWDSPKKLAAYFKKQKIAIVATHMSAKAKDPAKIDLARPVALVLGNEHDGVSKEMLKAADANVLLPMVGFIQSFNVSVAAALLLYEAYRQREGKGMYAEQQLKKGEMTKILKNWAA
ncbi:tRNA methyltransferase [Patescibacteria group bacterium]|jgi:tRNA (guanosine-2'-O-)-methyltransferase|nr:tRNA methyltransferase [Patescibacteria group bacterium]